MQKKLEFIKGGTFSGRTTSLEQLFKNVTPEMIIEINDSKGLQQQKSSE